MITVLAPFHKASTNIHLHALFGQLSSHALTSTLKCLPHFRTPNNLACSSSQQQTICTSLAQTLCDFKFSLHISRLSSGDCRVESWGRFLEWQCVHVSRRVTVWTRENRWNRYCALGSAGSFEVTIMWCFSCFGATMLPLTKQTEKTRSKSGFSVTQEKCKLSERKNKEATD